MLDLAPALPKKLGGKEDATNPKQLFAAGYAACFGNAVIHVSRSTDTKIRDNEVTLTGTVGLNSKDQSGFVPAVALDVTVSGVKQAKAEEIVRIAHSVCPYSNAIKGNVDVAFTVKAI